MDRKQKTNAKDVCGSISIYLSTYKWIDRSISILYRDSSKYL